MFFVFIPAFIFARDTHLQGPGMRWDKSVLMSIEIGSQGGGVPVDVIQPRTTRRARAVINRMIATRQLSPSGLKWLVAATDPFHDTEICPDGFPDILSSRTITQCVTLSTNVTTPPGLDPGELWDAHVFFAPLSPPYSQQPVGNKKVKEEDVKSLSRRTSAKDVDDKVEKKVRTRGRRAPRSIESNQFYRTTVDNNGVLAQAGTGIRINSGMNIVTVGNGDDWTETVPGTSNTSVGIPNTYASGSWRLIACGYEVHNVTAELYKGGTVTVYKSPGAPQDNVNFFQLNDDAGTYQSLITKVVTLPPTNQPDAVLYPNSRTWRAEDGCYQAVSLSSLNNPFITPLPGAAGMIVPRSFDDLADGLGWICYLPALGADGTESQGQNSLTTTLPFDICGSIFAGLNPNSSLQVTVKYYFERAPTIADPDLLVLARPPPPYDPMAFEIYSRALDDLPVAVPVGENPLGEWFADVLEAIGKYAPIVGEALGNVIPGAGAIGNLMGAGARGVHRLMPRALGQPALQGVSKRKSKAKAKPKKKAKQKLLVLRNVAPQGMTRAERRRLNRNISRAGLNKLD